MKFDTSLLEYNLDWDGLRYFRELSEHRTLVATALAMNVGEATVLRKIQTLERQFGVTVFARTRQGHVLTPEGDRLLVLIEDFADELAAIQSTLQGGDKLLAGSVAIATTEFGANYLLSPQLANLRNKHPALRVNLHVDHAHIDLVRPEPWIALRFKRPETGPYKVKKVGVFEWALYASKTLCKHLDLRAGEQIDGTEPYLDWVQPVERIEVARRMQQEFSKRQAVAGFSTLGGHLNAALSGLGVAHLPKAVGQLYPELVALEGRQPNTVHEAWSVVPTQYQHLARVQAVVEWVGMTCKHSNPVARSS